MSDFAISASPAVQEQLDRLWALSPGADILGLGRITRLLGRLNDPHLHLPPVFHVAGTNGKGSTCAFLRAALEASGYRVHAYTSPHLVRFNERIRIAGRLIDDDILADLLAEVLDAGGDLGASFFEVTTAAAFLAFTRTPADACVIEVGLGGRLDATNVVRPVITGIAALGLDHQALLGDTLAAIAAEKAGIAKSGVPLVTLSYPDDLNDVVAKVAADAGARLSRRDRDWAVTLECDMLAYRDAQGRCELPHPTLVGPHQADNLGLAAAMLRHQDALAVPTTAIAQAALTARWPARMQRLGDGPLTKRFPTGTQVWLDGGHNPSAGAAVAAALDRVASPERPLAVILGMLANKDAAGLLASFAARIDALVAIPVPGHEHHAPSELAEVARGMGVDHVATAPDVGAAADTLASERSGLRSVLILGSLYLAGEVLRLNDEQPD